MCVLRCCEYVSFGSKVRPRIFGYVAIGSSVLFNLFRLLLYYAESGVNRVLFVLSGFSVRWLCLSRQKLYVGIVVCISWLHSCLCVWM